MCAKNNAFPINKLAKTEYQYGWYNWKPPKELFSYSPWLSVKIIMIISQWPADFFCHAGVFHLWCWWLLLKTATFDKEEIINIIYLVYVKSFVCLICTNRQRLFVCMCVCACACVCACVCTYMEITWICYAQIERDCLRACVCVCVRVCVHVHGD